MFIKRKFGKDKGKPKINLQYEIVNKTDHNCVPTLAGIQVKVNWIIARTGLGKTCLCLNIQFIRKNRHLRERV